MHNGALRVKVNRWLFSCESTLYTIQLRVYELLQARYEAVDRVIAAVKTATVKNRTRSVLFHDIGQPPQPVVTRWGSWLEAALYYAEHMPRIKEIVNSFDGDGLLVQRAKKAVNGGELVKQLMEISRCYRPLIAMVKKMEGSKTTIRDAWHEIHMMDFAEDPCGVRAYLRKRLMANDITQIMAEDREHVSPLTYVKLQSCQPTSANVERSFSLLGKIVVKERNFKDENVQKYAMVQYNC